MIVEFTTICGDWGAGTAMKFRKNCKNIILMREAKQVEENNNDLMPGQAHFLGWEKSESFDKAEQMLEDYLLFGRLVS